MVQEFTYTVSYQQLDASRQMRLPAFVNDCVLNAAGMAADKMGCGIMQLLPYRFTWIISRLSLCLHHLPAQGDSIMVRTWVEQNAHMLSVRDFRFYLLSSPQPIELGFAKSVWAVLHLDKREIVDAFSLPPFANVQVDDILPLTKASRILPLPQSDNVSPVQRTHTIQYADVDYNAHCNSCRYIEQMLNTHLPECLMSDFRFDINYLHEVGLNDTLTTRVTEYEQRVYYQQLDQNQRTCCSAMFSPFCDW